MTLESLVTALDSYEYWEADSSAHEKRGPGAQWQGEEALARKTGATDTPTYYYLRITKKTGDVFSYHKLTVQNLDGDWTISAALP